MKRLPDKLSDCILLALRDLTKCEKDPKYQIYMDVWHQPSSLKNICFVCLAGAIMAKTLHEKISTPSGPGLFEGDSNRLLAIDAARKGWLDKAVREYMGIYPIDRIENQNVPDYSHADSAPFKKAMRKIAKDLKKLGY